MKKTFLIAISSMSLAFMSCSGNEQGKTSTDAIHVPASADKDNIPDTGVPVLSFEKTKHDFGTMTQGEKVEYSFKFTNTGDGQLLINAANASCGCTVPEFSKEPIPPGGTGYLKVSFDSENKSDKFEKTVTVSANTNPPQTELTISGNIIKK